MITFSPFSMNYRFPSKNYKPIEDFEGFSLQGMFVPHLQNEASARFFVFAAGPDGQHFTEVTTVSNNGAYFPTPDTENRLLEYTLQQAKDRILNGNFESGKPHYHLFLDGV